jgi:tetratricopeptide (TPR) repeat protein
VTPIGSVDSLLAAGRVRAAAAQALLAARALPEGLEQIAAVARALVRTGETAAARACLAHPGTARPASPQGLVALALVQQEIGQHAAALALMERARELGLDTPEFRYLRALQLQFNGRIAEAEAELEACLALGPAFDRASVTLARLRRWTLERNHLELLAQRLRAAPPGSEQAACLAFARYKELEDLGRDDEAWAALVEGNAIMRARLPMPASEATMFDAVIARCTPAFLAPSAHRFDGPMPIFIVGMPRSGTTLLERVLGNHSEVTPAGELADFTRQWAWAADRERPGGPDGGRVDFAELGRRYLDQTQWRAEGKRFYVDKLPQNYMLAGFIRKALPQAPIVHMGRAPMDLCFSNWRALFGSGFAYSYDLDALAAHHGQYRRLMRHWHAAMPGAIHDVAYEALVDDPEREARALLAHCGLAFEPQCLDTAGSAAPSSTLSTAQVREPIHRRGLAEWRRYAPQLAGLQAALRAQDPGAV